MFWNAQYNFWFHRKNGFKMKWFFQRVFKGNTFICRYISVVKLTKKVKKVLISMKNLFNYPKGCIILPM